MNSSCEMPPAPSSSIARKTCRTPTLARTRPLSSLSTDATTGLRWSGTPRSVGADEPGRSDDADAEADADGCCCCRCCRRAASAAADSSAPARRMRPLHGGGARAELWVVERHGERRGRLRRRRALRRRVRRCQTLRLLRLPLLLQRERGGALPVYGAFWSARWLRQHRAASKLLVGA